MALYNELYSGRFNRALQKLFGMKGGPPAPQLAGEVMPVVFFYSGVESRNLESWQRFGAMVNLGAPGVGNFNLARLRNPAGSGMVAIIEKVFFSNNSGAALLNQVGYGLGPGSDVTTLAALVNTGLDARGTPQPNVHLSTSQVAASALPQIYFASLAANSGVDMIQYENQELTILPGSVYDFWSNTANVVFSVSLWWRERALEDSEVK